jgi:transcriptional regulator with XRE-family HTH domain
MSQTKNILAAALEDSSRRAHLWHLCREQGASKVAARAGLCRTEISHYLRGRRNFGPAKLAALRTALGITSTTPTPTDTKDIPNGRRNRKRSIC